MVQAEYSEDGKTLIRAKYIEGYFEVPEDVTEIGERAFSGCSGLTSIDIPNSVTKIGDCAFVDCSGLTSIDIPNSVTKIGKSVFWGCTGLTSIDIPNSVTEIGDGAFWGCTGLTSIDIPNSVREVGYGAFMGCTGLTSVDIPNSVTSIGDYAFSGGPQLYATVAEKNEHYKSVDGSLYSKDGKEILHCYPNTGEEFAIPEGVETIGDGCFAEENLTKVYIPGSVKCIKKYSFVKVKLQELHIRVLDPEQMDILDWDDWFEQSLSECTLYIPSGTRYAYKHHPVFGKCKDFVIEK